MIVYVCEELKSSPDCVELHWEVIKVTKNKLSAQQWMYKDFDNRNYIEYMLED